MASFVGSENILLQVKASRAVVFDVLEYFILKALHQDWCESHRAAVIKTRHSRL